MKMMREYQVELTEACGCTSAIDLVTAEEGYTAEQYVKDCEENADEEWVEMLHAGTVRLIQL